MTDYEQLRQDLLYGPPSGAPGSVNGIERSTFSFWRGPTAEPMLNLTESHLHEWEHEQNRFTSICTLCGAELTELARHQGLKPTMRQVYDLCTNPSPYINRGALIAKVWEEVMGKDRGKSAFDEYWAKSDITPDWDEEPEMLVTSRPTFEQLLASGKEKLRNQRTG